MRELHRGWLRLAGVALLAFLILMSCSTPTATTTLAPTTTTASFAVIPPIVTLTYANGSMLTFMPSSPPFSVIKLEAGRLWLPTYLPKGYQPTEVKVTEGNTWLGYFGIYGGKDAAFNIYEFPYSMLSVYPQARLEAITVGGRKAFVLHGAEMRFSTLSWYSPDDISVIIDVDGWELHIESPGNLPLEELIRIAESMQEY